MYYIDQFDFDPYHIPGPANRAADALSRRPDFCAIVTTAFDLDDDLQPHFVKGYKSDPTYSTLYAELSSDHPLASHYRISDGFLLLHTRGKDLLVVPQDRILCTRLLGEFHDARLSAHLGVNRTLARLRQRFHWPDVLHDVTRYIELCAVCHRNKGRSRVPFGELKPLPIPRAPRLSIAMDVTGPFPRDRHGHDGILTVVDRLSKYARFLPCNYHAAAPELARLLHTGWITNQGVPEDIVSNRDTRFMSAFWTSLMAESGTTMESSSARHPQTDGQTERAHQTAQMMLPTLIRPDQKDWVDRLPDIEFAYNTSVHPTICVTPFELHHGGEKARIFVDLLLPQAADIDVPCSPASVRKYRDLLIKAHANMQKAQIRMQQQANRRQLPCPFREGDLVWVLSEEFVLEQDVSRKLLPKWFGPWEVTSVVGGDPVGPSFVVNIPPHLPVHRVFHASKLAIYTPPSADEFPGRRSQDPPSMDGHQEVDRVITHRKYGNKPMQFKVTFKQCAPDDTRWISSTDLQTSAPLIFADYEKRRLAKEAAQRRRERRRLAEGREEDEEGKEEGEEGKHEEEEGEEGKHEEEGEAEGKEGKEGEETEDEDEIREDETKGGGGGGGRRGGGRTRRSGRTRPKEEEGGKGEADRRGRGGEERRRGRSGRTNPKEEEGGDDEEAEGGGRGQGERDRRRSRGKGGGGRGRRGGEGRRTRSGRRRSGRRTRRKREKDDAATEDETEGEDEEDEVEDEEDGAAEGEGPRTTRRRREEEDETGGGEEGEEAGEEDEEGKGGRRGQGGRDRRRRRRRGRRRRRRREEEDEVRQDDTEDEDEQQDREDEVEDEDGRAAEGEKGAADGEDEEEEEGEGHNEDEEDEEEHEDDEDLAAYAAITC
ncbi:hypothetical protein CBR_g6297 [Chara braunii]|uniref:Integrase catalytic domain-containing protein n=1 Tax=Chara braunii TaxID=69332 RepID=A0A388KJG4_CHABU|nr:hypothetical protein CBR_g6297 [Chara braunii]|eukprot:GBG70166.1 hypothetical protein CBR_g6297 [Chara braunii]